MVFAAVADERRRIARLLDGLDPAQLATPSLCAGWDVKTVAAHVVSTVTDGTPAFLRLALRRGSMARAIDELARRGAQLPAAEVAASLHQCADRRISHCCSGRWTRSQTSWCTAATSGFRSACRLHPTRSWRRWRWIS
jgi:uncharacterized protein (TIGR03083 family)